MSVALPNGRRANTEVHCEWCGAQKPIYRAPSLGPPVVCSRRCGAARMRAIRMAAFVPKTAEERFFAKVDTNGPVVRPGLGPCHPWTAGRNDSGYGVFAITGAETELAHRVAFLWAHGHWPRPHGLHECDNPGCVKALPDEHGPAHVYEGTPKDNAMDKSSRGRSWRERCQRGHQYTPETEIWLEPGPVERAKGKGPRRHCRICDEARRATEAVACT